MPSGLLQILETRHFSELIRLICRDPHQTGNIGPIDTGLAKYD